MAKAKLESRVIYDNYGNDYYYLEAARESLAANCDNENPTDDELQQEAWEIMRDDWDETQYDHRSFFDGGNWLAVGTVGRWDGNHAAGTSSSTGTGSSIALSKIASIGESRRIGAGTSSSRAGIMTEPCNTRLNASPGKVRHISRISARAGKLTRPHGTLTS